MNERCPICGLRYSLFQMYGYPTLEGWQAQMVTSSGTEWLCSGHTGAALQSTAVPVQPERAQVPQAFYDAFSDDEVTL